MRAGSTLVTHRGPGRLAACRAAGWSSAVSFGVMGAMYAGVGCFVKRLRQKEDAWNAGAAAMATGQWQDLLAYLAVGLLLHLLDACTPEVLGTIHKVLRGMAGLPCPDYMQRLCTGLHCLKVLSHPLYTVQASPLLGADLERPFCRAPWGWVP